MSKSTNLVTFRAAVASSLKAGVSDFASVKEHGGRFDMAEIEKYGVSAPAAVVGIMGINAVRYIGGLLLGDLNMAVVLVTKDTPQIKRDVAMLGLVVKALKTINPKQRFADGNAQAPTNIRATNLFGRSSDANGIALWGIEWTQPYDLSEFDFASYSDFLTFASTMTVSANPDTPVMETLVEREADEDFTGP